MIFLRASSGLLGVLSCLGLTAAIAEPTLAQAAADEITVEQRISYNQQCRIVRTQLEMFSNVELGPVAYRVGTFFPGDVFVLTGLLSEGKAQVFSPATLDTGWVDASNLGVFTDGEGVPFYCP